jgi:hypothetical protein
MQTLVVQTLEEQTLVELILITLVFHCGAVELISNVMIS